MARVTFYITKPRMKKRLSRVYPATQQTKQHCFHALLTNRAHQKETHISNPKKWDISKIRGLIKSFFFFFNLSKSVCIRQQFRPNGYSVYNFFLSPGSFFLWLFLLIFETEYSYLERMGNCSIYSIIASMLQIPILVPCYTQRWKCVLNFNGHLYNSDKICIILKKRK